MEVDVGNATARAATPGVSRDALERLDERVARAHGRIAAGRGERQDGYAALALPETTDPDAIRSAAEGLPAPETVLLAGIGGSALGAATLVDALPTDGDLHVLDHLDPVALGETLETVDLDTTVLHVVSRSGRTVETLANALLVREAMTAAEIDWTERTLVTTGEDGPLRSLADEHDLPILPTPAGVPGRFSALSTTALPAAALCGIEIEELLAGGRVAVDGLADSLFETPAYAYGATSYALAVRGATVNALMPYAEGLETFAEWFAQLWAESLGKDGLGQVPVRALGVTDQHSQLQMYRAGQRAVQVSFLTVTDRRDGITVPDDPVAADLGIADRSIGAIADAELRATEGSLAASRRPSVRLTIPRLDPHALGELLVTMEAACILAAELFGVDAFGQPAVDWGKRATRALLRDEKTAETRAIADKHTLRVGRD